jgi:hypothetical protein
MSRTWLYLKTVTHQVTLARSVYSKTSHILLLYSWVQYELGHLIIYGIIMW